MITIKINNSHFLVKKNISILEACKYVGITVPRFCYHETLSVAGNCRMCLVEVENNPKPISSCTRPVEKNMSIFVDTPLVKKARENVIETLLLNHPLDCPICDQGGECDLQDQTKVFGSDYSRFFFNKRGVEDKNCGPLIKTIMTRCIHCTRCVRFGSEVAGVDFLGTLNRGTSTEIGSYAPNIFASEISGNVIDLCPVGALTSKPYAFKARPWELKINETIDITDSTGSNIYVNFKETEILRVLPKNNSEINENLISDKTRFSYDSVKIQRLQKLFKKTSSKFEASNWPEILLQLDLLLLNNKTRKVTFLINEELDLESLNILNFIKNTFSNTIEVKLIEKSTGNSSNSFLSWTDNKFSDLKTEVRYCFILSSNIRIESAILNAKIRNKAISTEFNIFNLGQNFQSSFPLKFINLTINSILNLTEAKTKIAKCLISVQSPLVVLGETFHKRVQGSLTLSSIFKKINPTTIMLEIKKSANSEIIPFLNFQRYSNECKKAETIIAVNLDDNITLRKLLLNNKKVIWFNTHGSQLAKKSALLVPVATSFEAENTYINFEQRPQKTLKTLNCLGDAREIKKILTAIYSGKIKNKPYLLYISFLNEIINNPEKFKGLTNIFTKPMFLNSNYLNFINSFSSYPLKASIENFYQSNKFTKNSRIMSQCSQERQKTARNFF